MGPWGSWPRDSCLWEVPWVPGQLSIATQALSSVRRPDREVNKAVAGEPPSRALSACCGQVAWAAMSQSPVTMVITGGSQAAADRQNGGGVLGGVSGEPYSRVSFQRTGWPG